jgi:hypothetical protein
MLVILQIFKMNWYVSIHMMLVSIHNSSNWTDTVSCIDTCSHASIHACRKLTCIDTNTSLYRYKHVKTPFMDQFSFIHSSNTKHFFFSTRNTLKTLIPKFSIYLKLNQNSQNLTLNHFKFITHSHSFINLVVQTS